MGSSLAPATEEEIRRSPVTLLRQAALQIGRLVGLVALLALLALGLAVLATLLQARRDEARSSDALIVLAPELPPQALVEHSFDAYRRGYAPHLLLIGPGSQRVDAALRERGVPAEAFIASVDATTTWGQMQAAAAAARGAGDGSALVVAEPAQLLLALKMARDLDLRAYGSPPPGMGADPLALLEAGARYWAYALARQ